MARLKVKQISDFTTAVQNLIDNDVDQGAVSIANNASSIATNATNIGNNASSIATNAGDITALEAGQVVQDASIDALEALATTGTNMDAAQNLSIDALEVLATAAASLNVVQDASIDALQAADGTHNQQIVALQSGQVVQDASIDALEAADVVIDASIDALQAADVVIDASIDSLETLAAANAGDAVYIKQGGEPTSTTSFRVVTAVRFSASDDLLGFVNGLEVHPVGITVLNGEEFGSAPVGTAEGYSTSNGQTFTMAQLGYDLEANDHIHVVGVRA